MKVVECRGSSTRIGECAGEEMKEEINFHIEKFLEKDLTKYEKDIQMFISSTERYLPHVLDEMKGVARGAGVAEDMIFALNLPGAQAISDKNLQECSNIVFRQGPSGPLWGKNNDGGGSGGRPVCVLKVYPEKGIPLILFTFCGFIGTGDAINAEGLASGHSSVGSRFIQHQHNVAVRLWIYEGIRTAKTTKDFALHLTSAPVYGKGFSQVVVDKEGKMCSPEIACPLVQLRWPSEEDTTMNCVNCYQLPQLENFTNRNPEGLENANGRKAYLQKAHSGGDLGLEHMKCILRSHGEYAICRHGGRDLSHTEYSMIGIPREAKALYLSGNPCEAEFKEIWI